MARDTATRVRLRLMRNPMSRASASAVAPSYMEALTTSMPSSRAVRVWYSKMPCRVPWLISGW